MGGHRFDLAVGGEIRKQRPAVIVSNDIANNKYLKRVQVIPLTSNVDRLYPSEAYVKVKGKKTKAMANQIATVSKLRLIRRYGVISRLEMAGIDKAIKTQLDLS